METTWEQVDITALGHNSYLWLKNTAKICILIHTPYANKLDCRLETEIFLKIHNTDTIWMLYGKIQYNGYIQQYGYNTDAIQRNMKYSLIP